MDLDADHAALLDHFQFLIGDTDYSVVTSDDPEDCCHNAKLLKDDNEVLTPIIYDFDSTGFVNPSYAEDPNVAIDNVKSGLSGYCFADEHLQRDRHSLRKNLSFWLWFKKTLCWRNVIAGGCEISARWISNDERGPPISK